MSASAEDLAALRTHLAGKHGMYNDEARSLDWPRLIQEHGQQHEVGHSHLHEGLPDFFADYRSALVFEETCQVDGCQEEWVQDFLCWRHDPDYVYWLFNGPRSWRWPIWLLDELLDRVPNYEDGRWYWKGGWGCRMRLHRWWIDPSEWSPASGDSATPGGAA